MPKNTPTNRPFQYTIAAQIREWAERTPAISSRLVQELISLIYPPTCAGCGLPVSSNLKDSFCPDCAKALSLVRSPYCPSCGIPNSAEALRPHLCGQCLAGGFHFDYARARGLYRGLLREVIHRFKYEGQTFLVRPLAQMLTEPARELVDQQKADLIMPVPLHYIRLRHRGFNQAALLARRLGSTLEISVDYSSLKRSRWTEPQTGLSRRQRAVNVKGAFDLIKPEKVQGKCVLLVDDVLTTGETVNQCSRTLKNGGTSQIVVLTVARTVAW